MLSKPIKKLPKSVLRTKVDRLASAYYRDKIGRCEAEGLDNVHCGGSLQWCHIFSRGIIHMRYEPFNNLVMCAGHHRYYTGKPIEWTRFLEKSFQEKLILAEQNRYKTKKIDYNYWLELFG